MLRCLQMSDLIIVIPFFGTLYMIKSPVFMLANTKHLTIGSHLCSNYSDFFDIYIYESFTC